MYLALTNKLFFNKGYGSDDKESACNAGDAVSIPGLERSPGEGNGNPLHLPGEFHGHLAGYSPWCCKELDMVEPERLILSLLSLLLGSLLDYVKM